VKVARGILVIGGHGSKTSGVPFHHPESDVQNGFL
jgi:hypothetical protein